MEIIKCNEHKRSKMNKYDPDYIKLKFTYSKNKHILFYGCRNHKIIKFEKDLFIYLFTLLLFPILPMPC